MRLHVEIAGSVFQVNVSEAVDLSIPLNFGEEQPNIYGLPRASRETVATDEFCGDTRSGGSCNVEQYTFIPHGNGTHTEGVGHISDERVRVPSGANSTFLLATLITVDPISAKQCPDSFDPPPKDDDLVISHSCLSAHSDLDSKFCSALIIRTLPNQPEKMSRDYSGVLPPFFSLEAIGHMLTLGVEHLLVDLPSLDRMFDEGKLSAHHAFWEVPFGSHRLEPNSSRSRTVTEMIFVPDEVKDGRYLLSLQTPHFVADAAPSRPILFPLEQVS